MKYSFCIVLLFLFPSLAIGQGVNDTIRLSEIRVLAKRRVEEAGLKLTRPDSIVMKAVAASSLSELISGYSPIFVKSYGRGSSATASFRGTAASHTQIMWNGMNLNSPMRGFADLSLLPVFFTDNVYLLHGGSSMVEGSGALGGSIHLQNLPDWTSELNVRALFETSSFQTHKTFGRVMAGNKTFKTDTRIFHESSENNFPFYNVGVLPKGQDTLENADYRKTGILQEFYYRPWSDQMHALRVWYQQSHRNLPPLMSYEGSQRDEFQDDNQLRLQYELKKYSDQINYHFFSGLNASELKYYRATPQFDFVNEHTHSNENSFLNRLRIFRKYDEKTYATLSVNINYYQVKIADLADNARHKFDRLESSLYVNLHMKPSDRFSSFILIRSENYDNHFIPMIPAAGMEWQFLSSLPLVLRANAARNYHKPALNDLYWLPGGNPDLLPEDGYTGDLSLAADFAGNNWSLKSELTGFMSKIENWILWQPAASGAYYWEAANVKDVFSRGIEYQATGAWKLNPVTLNVGGNYSYTRSENLNAQNTADVSRGKQLIYIPRHKGNMYLYTKWRNFSLRYDLAYTGKRYTTSDNSELSYEKVLTPYWLSKLAFEKQINWQKHDLSMKFAVENLMDITYQSILWRPMPGRHYSFTVALNFNKA